MTWRKEAHPLNKIGMLSLVIPAHNEEAVIVQAVTEARDALLYLGIRGEILVVNDGSKDQTATQVQNLCQQIPNLVLLHHDTNRGYGAALRTGFEAAQGEWVAFTDADCQFHLEDLERLLPLIGANDLVTGWREDRQDPPFRLFLSKGFNLLVDALLGIKVRDVDCALKVFRKESLSKILPVSRGFFANTEMIVRARQEGLSVAEVGVRHRPRAAGVSKVSLMAIPKVLTRLLPFWWTKVLHTPQANPNLANPLQGFGALGVLLLLGLLVFGLGSNAPLMEPTEARNAEVAREMLAKGNYVVPILAGEAYLDKPPLLYWSLMGLFGTLGETDRIARILPMLWGTASVGLVWWWLRREVGQGAALLGGLSLLFLLPFVHYGRLLTMDGLMGMWLLAAWVATTSSVKGKGLSWPIWWVASLFLGLAGLTKGPVAFVLYGLMAGPLILWDERLRKPGISGWIILGAMGVAPLMVWGFLVEQIHSGFVVDFLLTHHWVRFADPIDHNQPFWFYFPYLTLFSFPWSLGWLGAMGVYFRSPKALRPELPPITGVAMVGLFTGFLFFTLAGCKRPSYLVPIMPYLAIVSGILLHHFKNRGQSLFLGTLGTWKIGAPEVGAMAWLLGLVFAGLGNYRGWIDNTSALFWVILCLAGLVWTGWSKRLKEQPLLIHLGAWAVVVIWGAGWILPGYNMEFSIRGSLEGFDLDPKMVQSGQANSPLVLCYPQRFYSTGFYTPDAKVEVFGHGDRSQLLARMVAEPKAVVLVKSVRAWQELASAVPPGWHWQFSEKPGQFRAGRLVREP